MKQNVKQILLVLLLALAPYCGHSQVVVSSESDYDFDYLTPKTYEIGGITFEGAENLDSRVVLLVAGLQVGDRVKIPGDKIGGAIDNLWRQGMFEDVQLRVTRVQGNLVFLKIVLKERPRLFNFNFNGLKKGEDKKIREELKIVTGDVVTENLLRTSCNKIKGFLYDKGYTRAEVTPTTSADSAGRVTVTFDVKRGKKVKIDSLIFVGNKEISSLKLKGKMQKTHDVNFWKSLLLWKKVYWKKSRYLENDFKEDLDNVIAYYNEQGFRDARVVNDTVYDVSDSGKKKQQDRLKVKVQVHEGQRFFFRNITFSGNTVYDNATLYRALRINKGDPYNKTLLETNLKFNPSGSDISSLYMDNGYLFFRAVPVEVAVEGDSIDIEIRIIEGKQARVRKVWVEGNTITNDKIIMRELHTRPGDLFSREALMRSYRELLALKFFKEESVNPEPRPNEADGTVDIVYKVEEGNTSTINLSGGYGGGIFIATAGVQLNNFSVRNIFKKDAWVPLPAGDGQKLGINFTTNGNSYLSFSLAFTEPWLGGRRPQALSAQLYHTFISSGLYYKTDDPKYYSLKITGAGVSFSKRLKWPDDYFVMSHGLSYKHYIVNNYSRLASGLFSDGYANDIAYTFSISRNSFDSPYYTRRGSELSLTASFSPPFSALNGKDYTSASLQEKYKWLEYYKINLTGAWMHNLIGDLVLSTRFRFGWMGYYNEDIGLSPFGRYFVGGDGLSSWQLDGREVIPLRGYENNSLSPSEGASVFDRFIFELRHPIVENSGATIWVLGFLEGGNSWSRMADFQPFKMYNSAGIGVRAFLPMIGLIGVDWGYGFDGNYGGNHFHFSIGQSID